MLKVNVSLLSLNLEDNWISHLGAKSLAAALEINSTLTSLDISAKDHEGAISLRNALIWNQTLTYLNLNLGPQFEFESDIYVVNSRDGWIVRKNQTLFDLLFRFVNSEEEEIGNLQIKEDWVSSGSSEPWGGTREEGEAGAFGGEFVGWPESGWTWE